jgi:predicted site-specific integrase-resolvase
MWAHTWPESVDLRPEAAGGSGGGGATGLGVAVGQVVCGVGSGMNGHRRKLTRVLSDPAATVLVVEHRDRLTRQGGDRRLVTADCNVDSH